MTPSALAEAAEGLVGTRFRLHGRDPATGLDCIGLLSAAMAQAGSSVSVPTGYTLRLLDPGHWIPAPAALGFGLAARPYQPGDVVLLRSGPVQYHLAISGEGCWIHAHAGLRRVVRQPERPDGTIIHHWRLIPPS